MDRPEDDASRPFRGLPPSFRLKRQALIRALFDRSRSDVYTLSQGCIRLVYRIVPRAATGTSAPVQVGFAPGRSPKAVHRNRIKRVLREVYRLHQHILIDRFSSADETLTLMILHRGPEEEADERIRQDLPKVLARLADRMERRENR